jgi:flagellar hook-associated protein 1 FlgK
MSVSLNAALTGLKAAQRALDTISTNVANAQTEGYTRKILPQETLLVNGTGSGVLTGTLVRNVDKALLRDLARQVSISQGALVKQNYLDKIQDFHGASDAGRSISSQIGQLADAFSNLSTSPDSTILLNNALNSAKLLATKFNDFSDLLNDMRTQAEEEIASTVSEVNSLLRKIADLNVRITGLTSGQQSNADLQDQRDLAIRQLSQYIEVSSFTGENNKIVVMTKQGQTLADDTVYPLVFQENQILPSSYYPGGGLSGLTIGETNGIALNPANAGGALSSLFEMRDQIVPTYTAQLDEMAQKLAMRFQDQGLELFTDNAGNIPSHVNPPTTVSYVGFASQIQVNEAVLADPTLIRTGTTGASVLPGSNEIINKITEFALGAYAYQEAAGTANISAGTIFAASGMTQTNKVIGNIDLTDYVPDIATASANIAPGNQFSLTIGGVPQIITIGAGNTATDLVNNINAAFGSTVASLNGLGQLTFNTTSNVTIANVSIGAAGMADLGFTFGTYNATNPSFSVQVGGQSPVTVTITSATTAANLLATLNAIPGLDAALGSGGELIMTPEYGGKLTITNVVGTPLASLGMTVSNIAHTPFRTTGLGPDGTLSTGLIGSSSLEDYARNLVSTQSEDHALAKDATEKEEAFRQTLDQRNSNQSGVNIDEEMANLIRVQTAYAASARMITVAEDIFDELLAAFR